jgi:hypothetical protein
VGQELPGQPIATSRRGVGREGFERVRSVCRRLTQRRNAQRSRAGRVTFISDKPVYDRGSFNPVEEDLKETLLSEMHTALLEGGVRRAVIATTVNCDGDLYSHILAMGGG